MCSAFNKTAHSAIVLYDEAHSESCGRFDCLADAINELRRFAGIAWDAEPNRAPCDSWETCGREYWVQEFDVSHIPWKLLRSVPALKVSARGAEWSRDFEQAWDRLADK